MHGHATLIAFAVWGGSGAVAVAWASKRRAAGAALLLIAIVWAFLAYALVEAVKGGK